MISILVPNITSGDLPIILCYVAFDQDHSCIAQHVIKYTVTHHSGKFYIYMFVRLLENKCYYLIYCIVVYFKQNIVIWCGTLKRIYVYYRNIVDMGWDVWNRMNKR